MKFKSILLYVTQDVKCQDIQSVLLCFVEKKNYVLINEFISIIYLRFYFFKV